MKKILFLSFLFLICNGVHGQAFSVTAPNGQVVWGAENFISVQIDGFPCALMQVRSDNGKIKKVADCRYLLIPQRLGLSNITVSKIVGNSVIDLGYKALPTVSSSGSGSGHGNKDTYYTFKNTSATAKPNIVKPVVLFAGKNAGSVRKQVAVLQLGIFIQKNNLPDVDKIKIVSFNTSILENDMVVFSKYSYGPAFDEDVIAAIKSIKPGNKIVLTNIQCLMPNKSPLQLDNVFIEIIK